MLQTKMMRNIQRLVLAALVSASAVAVHAADDPEIQFVKGLRLRKFYGLAIEQCERMLLRKDISRELKLQASFEMAKTHVVLGDAAGKTGEGRAQREHYDAAIVQFNEFLKQKVTAETKDLLCDVRYERAELALKLTKMYSKFAQWTNDPAERTRFQKLAGDYSKISVTEFQYVRKLYESEYEWLVKNAKTDVQKERFLFVKERRGYAWLNEGWSYYYAAQILESSAQEGEKKRLLQRAVSTMKDLTKDEILRHYIVALSAHQCIGMSLLELKDYVGAHEHFAKIADVTTSPETLAIKMAGTLYDVRTYSAQRRFDKAVVLADIMLSEFGRQDSETVQAMMLERGKAGMVLAPQLKARAEMAKANEDTREYKRLLRECEDHVQKAVDLADAVAKPGKAWRRDAEELKSKWIEEGAKILGKKLRAAQSAEVMHSTAGRQQKDRKLAEAVKTYQETILRANPAIHCRRLLPDAWYNLAICYYDLYGAKKKNPEYFYYVSALCFENCAREYPGPRDSYGSNAAYNNVQFLGKLFEFTKKKTRLKPGEPIPDEVYYAASRYVRALDLMVDKYGDSPHKDWAVFQSAEVSRVMGDYLQAAKVYARVPQGHDDYAQAAFMTGDCYWLEASRLLESGSPGALPRAKQLRDESVAMLQRFVDWWYEVKGRLPKKELAEVSHWVARAKVVMGEILVNSNWPEPERATKMLEGIEQEFALDKSLVTSVLFSRIQANRLLGKLADAEKSLQRILEDKQNPELACLAARLIGKAYLVEKEELQKKGEEDAASEAAKKGAEYMQRALKLNPNQGIDEYMLLGKELHNMGEYALAEELYTSGIERFKGEAEQERKLWTLKAWRGDALAAQEKYEEGAKAILEVVRKYPKVIDYKQSLANCYEKMRQHDKAIHYWLLVSKDAKDPSPEYYEARYHVALNYVLDHQETKAYGIIAYLAETHPDMGGPEMIRKFTSMVRDKMPDKLPEFRDLVGAAAYQDAQENKE